MSISSNRSAPTGSLPTTAKTISKQGGDYDIVYDTLGGAFTVDAFKVVKRGGVVISLSGPPDRDFARREGAGWLVGVVVWLMGRKVYAASAEAGRDYDGSSRSRTATNCATSPAWWMAARSGR